MIYASQETREKEIYTSETIHMIIVSSFGSFPCGNTKALSSNIEVFNDFFTATTTKGRKGNLGGQESRR